MEDKSTSIQTGKSKNKIPIFCTLILFVSLLTHGCGGGGGEPANQDEIPGNTPESGSAATWSSILGGDGAEEMEGVWATSDGGYVVAGLSDSFTGDDTADALILKVSAAGEVEWAKTYGGSGNDMAVDIKQTADGGYIVAGWTESFGAGAGTADFWVFKLDSTGGIEWEKRYGGADIEQAWSVDIASDGYVVAGGTTSFGAGKADYWVLKLDAEGGISWQKTYGGAEDDAPGGDYEEYVARVLVDKDGNYVVASESSSFGHGDTDIWALKLDPTDGSVIWQYAYGDTSSDSTWSFTEAAGGGYIIPGNTTSGTDTDLWALSLETNGTIRWQKKFGLSGVFDEALTADATADGGAIIGGYYEVSDTDWVFTLLRVDSDGGLSWAKKYKYGSLDWPNAVQELNDGYIVAGVTTTAAADQELWLMRLASDGTAGASCDSISGMTVVEEATDTSPMTTDAQVGTSNVMPQETSSTVKDVSPVNSLSCSG